MAKQLLEFVMEDGEIAVFEVDRSELSQDLQLASDSSDGLAVRAREHLQSTLASIQPVVRHVRDAVAQVSPEAVEVEFGIKLGGETGVIFTKGTAEANFTVRLSWSGRDTAS
ncbi:CU044_2847 family protein [Streptomyces rubiginosohelvolus]|uniref:CU044_2847 family protein n=1 Tax=Streptomyces rubiginosohelvolus TaxID=67362 RepID=UPI0034241AC0